MYSVTSRILDSNNIEITFALPFSTDVKSLSHIHDLIASVLTQIEWNQGLSHIEFIATQHSIEIVEINPLIAGGFIGSVTNSTQAINIYEAYIPLVREENLRCLTRLCNQEPCRYR